MICGFNIEFHILRTVTVKITVFWYLMTYGQQYDRGILGNFCWTNGVISLKMDCSYSVLTFLSLFVDLELFCFWQLFSCSSLQILLECRNCEILLNKVFNFKLFYFLITCFNFIILIATVLSFSGGKWELIFKTMSHGCEVNIFKIGFGFSLYLCQLSGSDLEPFEYQLYVLATAAFWVWYIYYYH